MSVVILSGLGSEFVPTDMYKGVIGMGPSGQPYEVVPQPNDDASMMAREVVKVLDSNKAAMGKVGPRFTDASTGTKVAMGVLVVAAAYFGWKKWKK